MKDILLLTTQDCHLCLYAREMISEVDLKEYNLIEVDIYSKRDYVDRFWDKIPVLLINERELLWPFSSNQIANFLR